MAVSVIDGTIGAGKTMFLTWLGHAKYDEGYMLYSNYNLYNIEYVDISNMQDFFEIKTPKNFIMLDEFWLTADSRRSGSLLNLESSKRMLQSRKTKSEVMITSQDFKQLDVRIRNITEAIYSPQILLRDDNSKPRLLMVKIRSRIHKKAKVISIPIPVQFKFKHGFVDIANAYDTYEILDQFDDTFSEDNELFREYKKFKGSKTQLSEVLQLREGLDKSFSITLAGYIKAVQVGL